MENEQTEREHSDRWFCSINVRFGSKADICSAKRHVRFTPNSDRESGFSETVMFASSSGAAGSRPPSIPRAIRASSCASLMRRPRYFGLFSATSPIIQWLSFQAHPSRCCILSQQFSLRFNNSQSLPATPCDIGATWKWAGTAEGRPRKKQKARAEPHEIYARNFQTVYLNARLSLRIEQNR